MQQSIRNPAFAAKLALTYAELYDGISPKVQRVSLRVSGDGPAGVLELKNVETHAVQNWKLSEIRTVPDQARDDTFIFTPDNTGNERLMIRELEALRTIIEALPGLRPLSPQRGSWLRLGGMAVAAAAAVAAILFAMIPFMADRGAQMIPPQTETAMGQAAFDRIYTGLGTAECIDPAGQAALDAMQARLMQGTSLPYPLQVRVVSDPMLNATALPGGHVTLYSGLIQAAETPEEVAAVLAHEVGHVAYRDGTRSMLRSMGSFGLIGLVYGDFLGGSAMAGMTQAAINSSYSRAAEARADAYAHDMLARAGVSPAALGVFFERIRASGLDIEMGVFQHLSSHPELLDRIEASDAAAGAGFIAGAPILSAQDWAALQNICASTAATGGGLFPQAGVTKG